MKSALVQVFPPSAVRNTPRSALATEGVADRRHQGDVRDWSGSTTIAPICRASPRPTWVQLLPPSPERNTPMPLVMSPRSAPSPSADVDHVRDCWRDTATAPIEPVPACVEDRASTAARRPPSATPRRPPPPCRRCSARSGTPLTVTARPPRNGPMPRHCRALAAGFGAVSSAQATIGATTTTTAALTARIARKDAVIWRRPTVVSSVAYRSALTIASRPRRAEGRAKPRRLQRRLAVRDRTRDFRRFLLPADRSRLRWRAG